jgi:hypothetical protein
MPFDIFDFAIGYDSLIFVSAIGVPRRRFGHVSFSNSGSSRQRSGAGLVPGEGRSRSKVMNALSPDFEYSRR